VTKLRLLLAVVIDNLAGPNSGNASVMALDPGSLGDQPESRMRRS
jgi:hypothetical protein